MPWVEVFAVFFVSHRGRRLPPADRLAGDAQAGWPVEPGVRRRALLSHIATYTLAFVPA